MASLARPLVVAFLVFLAGLLPGLRLAVAPLPPALLALAVGAVTGAAALRAGSLADRRARTACLAVFALVGLALGGGASRSAASDCRATLADGSAVRLRGVLAANVVAEPSAGGRVPLLPLRVTAVDARGRARNGCGGEWRVRFPDDVTPLRAGTRLELHGEWVRLAPPPAPSAWPADPRLAGFLRVDSIARASEPRWAAHPLLTLRGTAEAHLLELFPRHGALADALLLGRRERIDPELRERFARAGMAHLLAISGMHVGLIAGIVLLVGSGIGVPRERLPWVAIAVLALYLATIGAPPSAMRAGAMISLALVGYRLQRPFDPLPLVVAAGFLILVHRPTAVLEPGFQLSFSGVLGILVARRLVLRRLPGSLRAAGWKQKATDLALASTAAFLATAPAAAWHFGLIAPVAVLANLPAVPLMGVALSGIAAAAIVEPVLPPVGRLLADGAATALDGLAAIASIAGAAPFGHAFVPRPQVWMWAAALAATAVGLELALRRAAALRWAAGGGVGAAVLLAWPAVVELGAARGGTVEIHFIDVGQGDAVAIRTPRHRWVLVDAGPADDRYDAGERRVLPFLRAHGAARLEALILTHPHHDHIGGAPAVLRALPVGVLIEPGYVSSSPGYLETLRAAEERDVPWRAARTGRSLELDGVRFEFLAPDPDLLDVASDANEISAVVFVRFGGAAALLTGDAYAATEHALVRRHGTALRAQILKAAHHGSYTSTSPLWLDTVRPELVVISAGRRNRFGHPAPEVLQDLAERGIRVARTDLHGTVSVTLSRGAEPRWRWAGP